MKARKLSVALLLGLISFGLFMFIGEALQSSRGDAGLVKAFILMAAYFFICQLLLSRGNRDAYRKDWLIMLALDATLLLVFFNTVLAEKREVILFQGFGILLSCCGGTFAGAVAASLWARRKRGQ
jgi:hypothetical protein